MNLDYFIESLEAEFIDGLMGSLQPIHTINRIMQNMSKEKEDWIVKDRDEYDVFLECYRKLSNEINYKKTNTRLGNESVARDRHEIIHNLVNHLWPEKVLLVEGNLEERLKQSIKKVKDLHLAKDSVYNYQI